MISILGLGSPLNKFERINEELSRHKKTVYVDLAGNDLTGDGSQAKPFKTLSFALEELTGTIRTLVISLGAGDHASVGMVEFKGFNNVFVTGEGRIVFDSQGGSPFLVEHAGVTFYVDIEDVSAVNYGSLAILGNGKLKLSSNSVSLTKCVGSLVNGSWGHNSAVLSGASVSSVTSITKTNITGAADTVVAESSTTYTNIT